VRCGAPSDEFDARAQRNLGKPGILNPRERKGKLATIRAFA
jgi:hypothetical protein